MGLKGKVALVTGIESAIGTAIARRFVEEGAQVAACQGAGTRSSTAPPGLFSEIEILYGNIADRDQAQHMVNAVVDRFGRLDILINYGAARRIIGTVLEISPGEFDEEMRADLASVIVLSAAAIPLMERSGGGAILNISSIAAAGLKGRALRSSSKAALAALPRAMAQDHGANGIRVNALLLGPVQEGAPVARADTPGIPIREGTLAHVTSPEDVAAAAHFLVSEEALAITGVLLPVDGGRSLPTL